MKTFIIAALSADGFISPEKNTLSMDWTSKEDKKFFIEKTKEVGVVVMGSKTFETFGARPLKDRRNIIYSRSRTYEGAETTSLSPKELCESLEKEGVKELAICGGSSIYTAFLEEGCVDRLYLTLENVLFGKGITLFTKSLMEKLKLEDVRRLGDNTVLLEYSVLK